MKKLSLSSSALKYIAGLSMLIDHVGILFFPDEPFLRVIGRVSLPLFAFLIAEGERKTSNSSKYLARLTVFAVISQLPYELFMRASGVESVPINIFATLSFGLLALLLLKRFSFHYSLPAVAVILFLSEYLSFDYGAYGILTILVSALFLSARGLGYGLPTFTSRHRCRLTFSVRNNYYSVLRLL